MKIILISDTHANHRKISIEPCDILIHSGDMEIHNIDDLIEINKWFAEQPAKHKICIAGNHDRFCEENNKEFIKNILSNVNYLENDIIEIEDIKIFGSPYSVEFNGWSFMKSDSNLKEIWHTIPNNIDIIITHGPPFGILDNVHGYSQGSASLRDRIKEIKPKLVVFGHIHENGGEKYTDYVTDYVNASLMNEFYKPVNSPILVEI